MFLWYIKIIKLMGDQYEKRPVEGDNIKSDFGEYRTAAEKGQSFVFAGGKWKDMTDNDVKNILKTDFEPGNCCNKSTVRKTGGKAMRCRQ